MCGFRSCCTSKTDTKTHSDYCASISCPYGSLARVLLAVVFSERDSYQNVVGGRRLGQATYG